MNDPKGEIYMVLPIYQQRNQRLPQPNPMYRPPNPYTYQQHGNRGGAASKPTSKIQEMIQRFAQPSAGGGTEDRGGGGLSLTLDNVQQVLKVVQSTAPMIQEYGPIVKNIPALYRMMKAMKNVEDTDEEGETHNNQTITKESTTTKEKVAEAPKKLAGQSTPKLFI